MKLSDLTISSRRRPKRVGRGISAGGGKTAGRGTKGQNSRSGGQRNPGFEGGQNPLFQRLPKQRGFKSHRPTTQIIRTSQLKRLSSHKTITIHQLVEAGLVKSGGGAVKLLFDGPLTKAQTIQLPAASQASRDAIAKAGGSFEMTPAETAKSAAVKSTKKA